MKRFACVSALFLLSLHTFAANYTVKSTGGGDYTNIQDCANAMTNGDTCTVYAGTYNENVTVPAGGKGAYKTITVNGSDVVYVLSFVLNSYTKLNGFHVQNPSSPNSARCVNIYNDTVIASTDVYITNNNFQSCQSVGTRSIALPLPSYVYVLNNTFSYTCSTPANPDVCVGIYARGDHWLIEGNDFSHLTTAIRQKTGNYGITRNNTYHDIWGRNPDEVAGWTNDCIVGFNSNPIVTTSGNTVTWVSGDTFYSEYPGSWVKFDTGETKYTVISVNYDTNHSMTVKPTPPSCTVGSPCTIRGGNGQTCHMDFYSSEPQYATHYNLVEGNTIYNTLGSDNKVALTQGDSCAGDCYGVIVRYNTAVHVGTSGWLDDNALHPEVNPGFYGVKIYNNTWADTNNYSIRQQTYGATNYFTYNSINGANINNLYYYPLTLLSFNPYASDASTNSTFVYRNNLAWCTGSVCNLHNHIYNQGNFMNDPGNIEADPKFTNYAAKDFSLTPTSPAVGAGSYLTTVATRDSGTGTTLLVNDAGFFQDGYGLLGVKADQIRVGTNTVVQITSINYATNTLNLAKSITRSPGDPIYLFSDSNGRVVLFGNAPNIGALPTADQQQAPAPPTGLTVSVS